jgi:hypothetical protein
MESAQKLNSSTMNDRLFTLNTIVAVLLGVFMAVTGGFGIAHPRAVSVLNEDAFMGRWYQTHGSAISLKTFEKNAFCMVIDYLSKGDNKFRVHTYEK